MSKAKLLATRLVVFALILVALVIAFPAGAHPDPCPPGWLFPTPTTTPEAQEADNNASGTVCSKAVPGENHGEPGVVYKDEHSH